MQIDIDMTQTQTGGNVPTKTIISAGLVGAAVPVASGALVPVAMSTFGVVTPGVGTYHAVGGLAATVRYNIFQHVVLSLLDAQWHYRQL